MSEAKMKSITDHINGKPDGVHFTQSVTISKAEYDQLLKYKDKCLNKQGCTNCKCKK